jgi:hypothetical protein
MTQPKSLIIILLIFFCGCDKIHDIFFEIPKWELVKAGEIERVEYTGSLAKNSTIFYFKDGSTYIVGKHLNMLPTKNIEIYKKIDLGTVFYKLKERKITKEVSNVPATENFQEEDSEDI